MILSIIIPCYNVERYISKCLYSIINQNLPFEKYEIICVNDGSTDNTLYIIEEIIRNNPNLNISLFSQKNAGLSATRNFGLEKANGQFVWFIDSDDFLFDNTIVTLINKALDGDVDLLWFDHVLIDEEGKFLPLPQEDIKNIPQDIIFKGSDFLKNYFGRSCMVWAFLFRREFLNKIGIRFEEGRFFEDILFTSIAIDKADRVCYVKILAYNYLIRENGSIMRDKSKSIKRIEDGLYIAKILNSYEPKANAPTYFNKFISLITIYQLRTASKIDKNFYYKCFFYCKKENLWPVNIRGSLTNKISQFFLNVLGKYFYYIAIKLK